jgi:hypothetical protein
LRPALGLASVLTSTFALGCQSEATKRCHAALGEAQPVVSDIDGSDARAVQTALDAVQLALDACAEAGRRDEHTKLVQAKNQLVGHLDYLHKKASAMQSAKLTDEELEELVRKGDPSCPRGLAYKHGESGKEVRCTGPQLVDLPWAKAEDYFRGRGFKVHTQSSPPTLKAEYGSEVYIYTYATEGDATPARCLTLVPPPGVPWQEAVSRATGVQPQLLEPGATSVKIRRGALDLAIEDGEGASTIRIGACKGE